MYTLIQSYQGEEQPVAENIQANYDELDEISRRFADNADQVRTIERRINDQMEILRSGAWQGQNATVFYNVMDDTLMPGINRLAHALDEAETTTNQVANEMRSAEEEAESIMKSATEDTGGSGAGASSGGAAAGATAAAAAPPPPAATEAGETPPPSEYEVLGGDNLTHIARDHGVSLEELLAANPGIENPDLIHPGQKLVIPPPGGTGGTTA